MDVDRILTVRRGLTADYFLRILESGAKCAALYATATSGRPVFESSLVLLEILLPGLVEKDQTSSLPVDASSLPSDLVAQIVQSGEKPSLATITQLVGRNLNSAHFLLMAQATAEARTKVSSRN